jgi:hypothetical protein
MKHKSVIDWWERNFVDKIVSKGQADSNYCSYMVKLNDGVYEVNFNYNENCLFIFWYLNGKIHREAGQPAYINIHLDTMMITNKRYALNGVDFKSLDEYKNALCESRIKN